MADKHELLEDNKDHFVVKHKDGSNFKVAKHGLDAMTYHKIKSLKMASGGEVGDREYNAQPADKDFHDPMNVYPKGDDPGLEWQAQSLDQDAIRRKPIKMSKGGQIRKFYEGGESNAPTDFDALLNRYEESGPRSDAAVLAKEQPPTVIADQRPLSQRLVPDLGLQASPPKGRINQLQGFLANEASYPQGSQERSAVDAELSKLQNPLNTNTETPPETLAPQMPAPKTADAPQAQAPFPSMDSSKALALQQQGIEDFAKAKEIQGSMEAKAYQANADAQQKLMEDLNTHLAPLEKARMQIHDDVLNSKVDPNRFMNNMSTGNRIMSAIGIVLGGAGAHWTGGKNLALDTINQSIANDIDAQKANIENKNSLYQKNLEASKNVMDATRVTASQMASMTSALVAKSAASGMGPEARANAKQLQAQLMQQAQQINFNTAVARQAMSGGGGGSALQNFAQKVDLLEKTGVVTKETANKIRDEGEKYANSLQAQKQAAIIFDKMKNLQTVGNRIMNPFQSSSQIEALKAELTNAIIAADSSKKLTPEYARREIEPYFIKLRDNKITMDEMLSGIQRTIRAHSGSTPLLDSFGFFKSNGR